MYQDFFGLKEAPFSIAPNPHYLYMSKQHHEALAHLVYGVGRDGGFVLLTGEVGTGKTTICRCFLEQIPEDTDVAFILNPKLNAEQLLATICDELGISYINDEVSIKELVDNINLYLLKSHAQGRHTVLIIDEAQNLSPEVLEQLRLLTNLETHQKKLLQIVLLGQPELQDMFLRPDLRQLAQRVTARFHLKELQLTELGPYVRHRLGVSGGKDIINIFPEKTLKKLYVITSGVPRIINLVCDRALLGAYAQNQRSVDVPTLEKAAREILGPSYPAALKAPAWFRSIGARQLFVGSVALGFGALFWWAVQGIQVNIDIDNQAAPQKTSKGSSISSVDASSASDDGSTSDGSSTSGNGEIAGKITRVAELAPASTDAQSDASTVASPDTLADTSAESVATGAVPMSNSDELTEAEVKSFTDLLLDEKAGDELHAYQNLFGLWNTRIKAPTVVQACQVSRRQGLFCLSKAGSLGYLQHLGLPAVVTLYAGNGKKTYAVLRGLDKGNVILRLNDEEHAINESAFNQLWRGQFAMVWKAPEGFTVPLQPGSIAPLTRWLRDGFSVIDKQVPAQTGSTYDPLLVERVKAFQREVGEIDDGIVGEATLIHLSRRLDNSLPLLTQESVQ